MKFSFHQTLYLVTNRNQLSLKNFFKIVQEAVEGGVDIVQLREKQCSFSEMCDIGRELLAFLSPRSVPLIINDRVDVAKEIKADGVHLGQTDLNVSHARKILGTHAIIGLSVETIPQAMAAQEMELDYIAVSPLFSTKTKTDCHSEWGLEKLKTLCEISSLPVIAIGGINEHNVSDVMACGVDGVAVVQAIFDSTSPETAAKRLLQKIKQVYR